MAYNTSNKTLTDNPLMDEICHNCKKILDGIVVKNDVLANNSETANSIQNAEVLYILKEDGYVSFNLFPFTEEILLAYGYSAAEINAYLLDKQNIPVSDRDRLTNFANQYFKDHFEEENNYYRMLNGLPQYNTGEEFFVYITKKDFPPKYTKTVDYNLPLHLQPDDVISLLYNTGVIAKLREKYVGSKYSYLNFLGPKRIDIYTARKANKWDILYMPNVYYLVEDKFTEFYKKNRELYHTAYYQEVYADTGEFYDQIMIIMLIAETFANMITDTPEWYIKRDIFDIRSVKYFLDSYGVEFFKEIPLKYQIRIVKNINKLIKFKSSNKNLEDIVDMITTSDNVKIIKYWLFKSRVKKKKGQPKPEPVNPLDPETDYDFNILLLDGGEDDEDYNYGDVDLNDETATKDINCEELSDDYVPPVNEDDDSGYVEDEDEHNKYDLEFISSNINDSYDNYIKDRIYRTPYDDITYQDKYWDGEDSHEYIKNSIKDQDFTIRGTKYMSIEYKVSLSEYMFQVQYFLGMILDSKIDVNDITISVPTLDENVQFSISNLLLYLIILSTSYDRLESDDNMLKIRRPNKVGEGEEPSVNESFYDWKKRNIPEIFKPKYGRIHAFNPSFDYNSMVANIKDGKHKRHSHYIFGASYNNVNYDNPRADHPLNNNDYAERAKKALDELKINDFRRPPAKYEDLNDIIDDYKHNKKCYETLVEKIKECDNQDDYATLAYVYQEMYTREFDNNFYKLSDGRDADDLLDLLLDRDYVLYDHYYDIMRENNLESRRDQIRAILNDIVETLEYYISGEGLEYIFSFTPVNAFYNIVYYIWLMIGFFKSYKVHFLDPYVTYVVDNKSDPLDNSIPTQDTISGMKTTYWKWDNVFASDNLNVTPSFCMEDESKVKEEAMDFYYRKDYDPLADEDYDCLDAENGEQDGFKDLNGGVADDKKNYPFEDIDAGKSYLTMTNINDVDGSTADESYKDYTDIDGGKAYILEDEKKDCGGSQGFNFELDGGSSSPFFFKSRTIQVDIKSKEIQMNVVPSNKEDNKVQILEDGVYVENFLVSQEEFDDIVNTINNMIEDIRLSGLDTAEDIMSIDSFDIIVQRISDIIDADLYNLKTSLRDIYYGEFEARIKRFCDENTNYIITRYANSNPYAWENIGGYR